MQLVASPLQLPVEGPFDGTMGRRALPCHLQTARSRVGPDSHGMILPTLQAGNLKSIMDPFVFFVDC